MPESRASYYPVLERWRTTEHTKLSAKQNEEKTKYTLELFEKSFEYEHEKLLQEATKARHKVELVEVDSKNEESICDSNRNRTHSQLVRKNGLSTCLRTKWLWVRVPLQSLKLQISSGK